MDLNGDSSNVRLFVRDYVSSDMRDRQRVIYKRLRELQADGRIMDLSAEMWSKQLYVDAEYDPMAADEHTRSPLSTYKEFSEWAERAGYSLEPGFSTQTVGSLISDKREKVIRFPVVCLAAYDGDDDDLIDVAPRSSERGGVYTVENFLEALHRVEKSPAVDSPSNEAESRTL